MITRELPVWRSLLYVPANVEAFISKAHTRGADVIQLDLEDSVAPSEKATARANIQKAAARVRQGGADVVVRINRPLSLAVRDIEESVCPEVNCIACTKVESATHVVLLDELITEVETRRGLTLGHTKIITMVESADAFFRLHEIARASSRIVACNLGSEDFALDCNMQPTTDAMRYPKQQMIIAASAAGIMPFGFIGSIAGFGDLDAFRKMVKLSREFGLMGAGCVHPTQIPIVNQEFTPGEEEVAHARKITELDDEARKAGRGSFSYKGRMIDVPVVERARKLVRRFEAIQERETRTVAAVGRG